MKPEPPESPPSWTGLKFHLLMPELQKYLRDFAHFQTHSLYFHLQSLRQKKTFSLTKPSFPSIQPKQHRFLLLICKNYKLMEISFKLLHLWPTRPQRTGRAPSICSTKHSDCQTLNSHLLTIYTYLSFQIVLLPLLHF